ncbi:hypothetical protein KC335_g84 [Hortaea werneckii]|nr:hypothetical protein KC335_g84 [Hortaea werneckii]
MGMNEAGSRRGEEIRKEPEKIKIEKRGRLRRDYHPFQPYPTTHISYEDVEVPVAEVLAPPVVLEPLSLLLLPAEPPPAQASSPTSGAV